MYSGFQALARDITALKQVEEDLRRNQDHAERLAKETAIMADIGRVISSTLNIEEGVREVRRRGPQTDLL